MTSNRIINVIKLLMTVASFCSGWYNITFQGQDMYPLSRALYGAPLGQAPAGSARANGREPKTFLGRVFNYKLSCFEDVHETHVCGCTPTSIVENSAQVLSCQLKFVHGSRLIHKYFTVLKKTCKGKNTFATLQHHQQRGKKVL